MPIKRINRRVREAKGGEVKTKITKGSRVLIKSFFGKISEGIAVDAQGTCIKVRRRWGLFYWTQWLPIKSDEIELEFILNEPEN